MINKLFLTFWLCLFLGFTSYSQNDSLCTNNIFTTAAFRKGFYKNIDEFRTNQPTIRVKKVQVIREQATIIGGGWYDIVLLDTALNYKSFCKKIWGFCSGDAIYICDGKIFDNNEKTFSKVVLLGRISLVECHDLKAKAQNTNIIGTMNGALLTGAADVIPHQAPSKNIYMLNSINNTYKLFNSLDLGETLYLQDKELFEEFRNETEKDNHLVDYVVKFNKRKY